MSNLLVQLGGFAGEDTLLLNAQTADDVRRAFAIHRNGSSTSPPSTTRPSIAWHRGHNSMRVSWHFVHTARPSLTTIAMRGQSLSLEGRLTHY